MARHRKSRGLALIAVLWLVSLLTVLATSMLAITRSNARMSSRSAQFIEAATVADSAIRLTLARSSSLSIDGFSTTQRVELFDRTIDVRIEHEAGRVDLNATEAPLLTAVFVAGGIDAQQAETFAARIIDWRDADDERTVGGAERSDYELAKIGYEPRNGPFESVGELQQVSGLNELSPSILDAFTVYSTRSPTISREYAHPLVRGAVTSSSPTPHSLIGQAVRVHACIKSGEMIVCRVAVVRLMNSSPTFLIHAWYTEA